MLIFRRTAPAFALLLLVGVLSADTAPAQPAAAFRQLERDASTQVVHVASPATAGEARASAFMDSVRDQPLMLRVFLQQMPKGGDIHNHLAGAVYAEDFITIAARHGLCVDSVTFVLSQPPCDASAGRPAVVTSFSDSSLYNEMIDAWSMRSFEPALESGHDHFFNTFGKFSAASSLDIGDQLAAVASHAASQDENYLELMHTVDGSAAADLGLKVGWETDLGDLRSKLMAAGMQDVVNASRASLDDAEAQMRSDLECGTPNADAGCEITIRYLYQAIRIQPPERVFAQFVLGFLLAQSDPRVVGINLVAPEDDYVARRDYSLQMSMLNFLFGQAPSVNISLHAGELSPGLVPPSDLRFHIREAIEKGHAKRIGHGVAVMYEDDPFGLLSEMAARGILVETSLISNEAILRIEGDYHPLPIYISNGVPVALATDDEGVSRSDLTAEYQLAAETFGFGYSDLKWFARNSIEFSFLPGADLWRAPNDRREVSNCAADSPTAPSISPSCQAFLDGSERAQMQWQLEQKFSEFEDGF